MANSKRKESNTTVANNEGEVLDTSRLTNNNEESRETIASDVIELEWEEISEVFAIQQETKGMENYFSNMVLGFEKTKSAILGRLFQMEEVLYAKAEEVKVNKGVDPALTYELKLPEAEGEKGYFVRKE